MRILLASVILAVAASQTIAEDRASATGPSSAPASQPAIQPIELSGYLAPIDPQEIKLKLKQFTKPLKVAEVAKHGAAVKAGQPLITFDLTEIDQDILEATSDLEVAKASLAKAESDSTLGDKGDAATLEERTDAVADAELNLAWWRDIDGPDFLRRLDQMVQANVDGINDQEDELDQLKKMYKSEELTNATADIVVKRAVRQLERSKQALEVTKHAADKQKATEFSNQRQGVERALEAAQRSLADAKATIAQTKVSRAAAILKSRDAVHDAQKKLSELEKDKQAIVGLTAEAEGTAYYGMFKDGVWQGAQDDAIKVGEPVETSKVILTVIPTGKLRVFAKVDEANLFKVHEGDAVTITPAALAELKTPGTVATRDPAPAADGSFSQKIELTSIDPRLMVGMKVKIQIGAEAK